MLNYKKKSRQLFKIPNFVWQAMRFFLFLTFMFLFTRGTLQAQFHIEPTALPKELNAAVPQKFRHIKHATSCTGNNGAIYVCWPDSNRLVFQRSTDNGTAWLPETKTIVPITYKNKESSFNGWPVLACDQSSGQFRGRLYACWSDDKNGTKDKDVFLVYSDDGGDNWTEPVLVTYRPNHKEQLKPALAIDESTGRVYLSYFDRQNYLNGPYTDVCLAVSDNGGLLFNYYKLNHTPVAYNAGLSQRLFTTAPHTANIFWPQTTKGNFVSAAVTDSLLDAYTRLETNKELRIEKTVAFTNTLNIHFSSSQPLVMGAAVYKPLEPGFEKIVFKNTPYTAGSHQLLISTKTLGLAKGNYVLCLYYNGRNTYLWITEE